jgi:hypothetical protein
VQLVNGYIIPDPPAAPQMPIMGGGYGMPTNVPSLGTFTKDQLDALAAYHDANRRQRLIDNPNYGQVIRDNFVYDPSRMAGRGGPGAGIQDYGSPTRGSGANPIVRNAVDSTMGLVSQALNQPGLTVTQTPKSQTQNTLFQGAVANYNAGQPAKQQSLTDFTKEFFATAADRKNNKAQEDASINSVYSGNLQAQLDALQKKRMGAINVATQKAITRARMDNNLARLGYGGAGSSYLDRAYGDSVGNILTQEAVNNANLGRDNLLYVRGEQDKLLGQRQNLARSYFQDMMLPNDMITRSNQGDISTLQGLANLENGNSIYELPEDRINRRLGLLGSLQNLDQVRRSL